MKTKLLAAGAAVVVTVSAAYAAGIFQTLPIIGGAAYCAASNVSGAAQGTITGQGGGVAAAGATTGTVICNVSTPAGPATFAGTEVVPMDLYPPGTAQTAGGAQTALANITQLGQGPLLDVTSPATATIPANTPFYILDGAQAGAFTITMPAAPIEGQFQRIACDAATVGTLTVSANAGQTLKNNPAAACVAGVGYAWRFQASNTTWYRIQ